jgi:hypothetical protein
MKPKYLPGLIIGIFLIYLGIFGLQGLGIYRLTLTGDFFKEDFNSSSAWTVVGVGSITINPVGQLQLKSDELQYMVRATHNFVSSYPSQWTIEFCLKVDNWGQPQEVHQYTVASVVVTAVAGYTFGLAVGPTQLLLETTIDTPFIYATDNNFHVYTLVVDATTTSAKIDCYIDATKVTSWIANPSYPSSSEISIYGLSESLSHVDYLCIDTGLKPPGTTPTTGTLRVFASYQGSYVATSITVSGPQSTSGITTTDPYNPLKFEVALGTYTVSGNYNSVPISQTATVVVTQTVDVVLNFGGTPVSPPTDFIGMIKNFFNNLSVRALMLIAGLLTTAICGIMFIARKKKRLLISTFFS